MDRAIELDGNHLTYERDNFYISIWSKSTGSGYKVEGKDELQFRHSCFLRLIIVDNGVKKSYKGRITHALKREILSKDILLRPCVLLDFCLKIAHEHFRPPHVVSLQ